jgi:hypothetical protein
VETLDVIDMEMAEQQEDRLPAVDMLFHVVDAVSGVEQEVVPFRLHEGADRVARRRIVPAVRSQKNNLHIHRPPRGFSGDPPACRVFYTPAAVVTQPLSSVFSGNTAGS